MMRVVMTTRMGECRTKEVDVDFLEVVYAAELVEFVVDLVVDERLVVVGRVVAHDFVD